MAKRKQSVGRNGAKRNGAAVTPPVESDRFYTDGQNGNTVKATERYCYKRSAYIETCIDSQERRMLVEAIHDRIEATPTRWLAELLVAASRWAEDDPVTDPFGDRDVDDDLLGEGAAIVLMKGKMQGDAAEFYERGVFEESKLYGLMSFDDYMVQRESRSDG